ncbi:hypothetical protein ACOTVP_08795 [Aliarcobacter butzleri]
MSKRIELTPSQIKAYENEATMFLFPISDEAKALLKKEDFIYADSPIKKGDKVSIPNNNNSNYKRIDLFYIVECIDIKVVKPKMIARKGYFDGADINENILKGLGLKWIGYMSRESYEDIGYELFVNLYNQQMKEQNINRTYEDNDYVFLVEFK